MNNAIVNSINLHVAQDDELYCLGDWSFAGIENIWNFRKQIICKNIHLILGNHDQNIKKNKILPNCWYGNYDIFSDTDEDLTGLQVSAQELFTSVQNYLELKIDKQIFVLSHYPIEEWFEMDRKGSIMLHGHVHHKLDNSNLNTIYKRMDVGIDWKEFRPYSLEEILNLMKNRKNKKHS